MERVVAETLEQRVWKGQERGEIKQEKQIRGTIQGTILVMDANYIPLDANKKKKYMKRNVYEKSFGLFKAWVLNE